MKARVLSLGVALTLAFGLLTASPAAAAYTASITFPGGNTEFYSPFGGPASIQFDFQPGDPSRVFRVRLRPTGGAVIKTSYFSINPDSQTSPVTKQFSWPGLSANVDKPYQVLVNPDGQANIAQASFILRPRLVSIVSASPNPFLPWIDDDIKDETTIRFKLAATSQPTEAHVYRANAQGKCCGDEVRFEDLGTRVPGTDLETWVWDGRNDSSGLLGKGDYFVKIRAEDPANVVKTSLPFKVSIARTYRANATLQKSATAYHHVGPVTAYLRGGNCFVTKAQTDLWITCLHAKFTIYWRWNLPNGGRVENVSWTFVPISGDICRFTKGHTTTDSWMRAGATSGQVRCRVDLARVTYSFLKNS
ncbi:MAG TPA: hypothetical protein VNP90_05125 [Actinomycetota bacterium]|nr:hypothetical protein [Actinomycetota bacterium]